MDFHDINMKGYFKCQEVATLPDYVSSDKRRIIYVLDEDTIYFGGKFGWKKYDGPTSLPYIKSPTVTIKDYNDELLEEPLVLISSIFTTINDMDDHVATSWKIYTEDNKLIWSSLNNTTNLTSITIPSGVFVSNTLFRIGVIHHGIEYGASKESSTAIYIPLLNIDPSSISIGDFYNGGYYAGDIDYETNRYMIIVSPKSFEFTPNPIPESLDDYNPWTPDYGASPTSLMIGGGQWCFSEDGKYVYISVYNSGEPKINCYYCSSPYNLNTASLLNFISVDYDGSPAINEDGTKFIVIGKTGSFSATLEIPYDITSLSNIKINENIVLGYDTRHNWYSGSHITQDGSYVFVPITSDVNGISTPKQIKRYSLSTPWDISSTTSTTSVIPYIKYSDPGNETNVFNVSNIMLKDDGTKVWITCWHPDWTETYLGLYEYTLATPYDISSFISSSEVAWRSLSLNYTHKYNKFNSTGTYFSALYTSGYINMFCVAEPAIFSEWDGLTNTNNINTSLNDGDNSFYDTLNITSGGYSDWYVPSKAEMDVVYRNFKPTTDANDTTLYENIYTEPDKPLYVSNSPTQTTVTLFKSTGSEYFNYGLTDGYELSNYDTTGNNLVKSFYNGSCILSTEKANIKIRPIRRIYI